MKRATWKRISVIVLSLVMLFTMTVGVYADQTDNQEKPTNANEDTGAYVSSGIRKKTINEVEYEVWRDANGKEYLVDENDDVFEYVDDNVPGSQVTSATVAMLKGTGNTTTEIAKEEDAAKKFTVYRDAKGNVYYVYETTFYVEKEPFVYKETNYDESSGLQYYSDDNGTVWNLDLDDPTNIPDMLYIRQRLAETEVTDVKSLLDGVPDEKDVEAAITKVVRTGYSTKVPQMTFTFKFEQLDEVNAKDGKNYDSQGNVISGLQTKTDNPVIIGTEQKDGDTSLGYGYVTAEMTEQMTTADAGLAAQDNTAKTISFQTEDFLNGVTFPNAGVYVYKVTEVQTNKVASNYEIGSGHVDGTEYDASTKTVDGVEYDSRTVENDGYVTTVSAAKHYDAENGYKEYDVTLKEELTYSQAEYTVYVYVGNKEDGSGTYIYGIGSVFTQDDNGKTAGASGANPGVGSKTNPTPWEDPGSEYDGDKDFTGTMAFTNDYTKYKNGSPTPEDEINPQKQQLAFSKKVTGQGADQSKYFEFDITLTKTATAKDTVYYGYFLDEKDQMITPTGDNAEELITLYVYDGEVYLDETEAKTAAGQGNEDQIKEYKAVKFEIGTDGTATKTIGLKHNEHIAFINTPVGTLFEAEEKGAEEYKPEVTVWVNNVNVDKLSAGEGEDLSTASSEQDAAVRAVGENVKNGADFVNELKDVPITGILMNNFGFVMMILAAVAALIAVAMIRAKAKARS